MVTRASRPRQPVSTILSLTPAMPNWRALYATIDQDGTWEEPVACWALVEVEDDRHVEGMVPSDMLGLERAEAYEDQFVRYLAPGQQVDDEVIACEVVENQAAQRRDREREQARAATATRSPNGRPTATLAETLGL